MAPKNADKNQINAPTNRNVCSVVYVNADASANTNNFAAIPASIYGSACHLEIVLAVMADYESRTHPAYILATIVPVVLILLLPQATVSSAGDTPIHLFARGSAHGLSRSSRWDEDMCLLSGAIMFATLCSTMIAHTATTTRALLILSAVSTIIPCVATPVLAHSLFVKGTGTSGVNTQLATGGILCMMFPIYAMLLHLRKHLTMGNNYSI